MPFAFLHMKIMKKTIFTLIMIISALFCLGGCGDSTVEATNHERPILNLCLSLEHGDAQTYLNCFVPAAKKAYLNSDSSSGKKDILSEVYKNSGLEQGDRINYEIIGKLELASADREKLQKQYKSKYSKNVTIEKAFQIDVNFTTSKSSDLRRLNTVLIDGSWYIFDEVIDKFKF